MRRLFGTDGIRGVANEFLSCERTISIGRALGHILSSNHRYRPKVLIGMDTRISSDMLASAMSAGLCSVGSDVMTLGVVPTPAVAYLVKKYKAKAGVMISASHNPFEYNGIKIFGEDGFKLSDELEEQIESIVLDNTPPIKIASAEEIGRRYDTPYALHDYISYLMHTTDTSLDGMRIAIDASNGSASATAEELFRGLGADVIMLNDKPNGLNINENCGSTHMQALKSYVKQNKLDAGIAFDGDADRCLAVDENGNTVDGDKIMALCGKRLLSEGKLNHNTIVATVMSNMGFHKYLKDNNMSAVCASVGDRYVLEQMLKGGFNLGGEQSGHIIFKDFSTTGDGELTAIKLISLVNSSDKTLSELVSEIPTYPQILLNVKVSTEIKRTINTHEGIKAETEKMSALLGNSGRILLRPSGTEDLVRIMVEADTMEKARDVAEKLQEVVLKSCCL